MKVRRLPVVIQALAVAFVSLSGHQNAGALEGRVLDGAGDVPVAFALVEIRSGSAPGVPGQRYSTRTDEAGHFSLKDIQPQSYYLAVIKPGYAPTFYTAAGGTTKDSGDRINIGAAATISPITIHLQPGGVITGRITNHFGQPQPGASLSLRRLPLLSQSTYGPFYFSPPISWQTDLSGEYRLFGLAEGDYIVSAEVYEQPMPVGSTEQQRGSVPKVFYPGTTDMSHARTVQVRAGAETAGVDIQLRIASLFTISGRVPSPAGERPSMALWTLPANEYQSLYLSGGDRFNKSDVTPGRYRITAYTRGTAVPGQPVTPLMWAWLDVTISDSDVSDIILALQPGMSAAGRFEIDAAIPSAPLRVVFQTVGRPVMDAPPRPGIVGSDGQFIVSDLIPGTYTIAAYSGNSTRVDIVATLNGSPVPANQIEVTAGSNITGLAVRVKK